MNNGTWTQTNRSGLGRFAPTTAPSAGLCSAMPTTFPYGVKLAPCMGIAGISARHAGARRAQVQLRVPTRRRC
jgi:hypothetical protein